MACAYCQAVISNIPCPYCRGFGYTLIGNNLYISGIMERE
jgi:hypothetical protein